MLWLRRLSGVRCSVEFRCSLSYTWEYEPELRCKQCVFFVLMYTDVLEGYNGTIFAYGQTSSGKTHTMEVI